MRSWRALVCCSLLANCAHSKADVSPARNDDSATLLRNYALAQCVSRAYPEERVQADARAAAGAYLEFGAVSDVEAYPEAVALAEQFLARHYASKSGESLQLMKCIDLFNSKELETLVRRYSTPPR